MRKTILIVLQTLAMIALFVAFLYQAGQNTELETQVTLTQNMVISLTNSINSFADPLISPDGNLVGWTLSPEALVQ